MVDAWMRRPHTRTGSHIERGQSTETINQYNVPHTPTSTSTLNFRLSLNVRCAPLDEPPHLRHHSRIQIPRSVGCGGIERLRLPPCADL